MTESWQMVQFIHLFQLLRKIFNLRFLEKKKEIRGLLEIKKKSSVYLKIYRTRYPPSPPSPLHSSPPPLPLSTPPLGKRAPNSHSSSCKKSLYQASSLPNGSFTSLHASNATNRLGIYLVLKVEDRLSEESSSFL